MRTLALTISATLFAGFLTSPRARTAQQTDAPPIVAAARQALGGDSALAAVTSFTVTGSIVRSRGTATFFEILCELPDRFLRIGRRKLGSPGGPMADIEITDYDGFVGSNPIRDTVAPDAPFPMTIPAGPPPTTPLEIAQARERLLNNMRRLFLSTAAPLFVTLPGGYGIDVSAAGKAPLNKGMADVLELRRSDGAVWRLLIDETTHLPAKLTWQAKPIVTMSSSSLVTVTRSGRDQSSRPTFTPPSGDPTVGLADVTWEMAISDYKVVDGLNWPRHFITSFNGEKWEDIKFDKFKINPKIDPKRFEIKK